MIVFFFFAFVSLAVLRGGTAGGGDSLRSAISAMDRRQRDLTERQGYFDPYAEEKERDDRRLAFLPIHQEETYDKPPKNNALDLLLLDYLEETGMLNHPEGKPKRLSTSFRERLEEDKERQREQYAKFLLNSLNSNRDLDEEAYKDLLQAIWDQYQSAKVGDMNDLDYFGENSKRYIYTNKRRSYEPEEYVYLPNEEEDGYEDYGNFFDGRNKGRKFEQSVYSKRYPLAKRSSEFYPEVKRSTKEEKTDPKVERDLSGIFGGKPPEERKPATKTKKTEATEMKEKKRTVKPSKDEKIQLKKKSIDLSDYFGFDHKKKSENLDDEWLMERYHKSMALTAKRSNEYPLEHFTKTDEKGVKSDEAKIKEMDEKLKNLEDSVLDDTLKYAGSHEGAEDPKEVQDVKDRVISRLAAAYNLEKMRRALGEYKLAMAQEKTKISQMGQNEDFLFTEEKRVSVPRKQAVDEEMAKQEEENNIKCIRGGHCDEQNVRAASDVLERYNWKVEECPRVQRACNDFALSVGKFEREMETSCDIHQLCLLCDDNNWYPPTRKCNSLFLAKSTVLCQGNEDCQKTAQRSLGELILLNSSLKGDALDECNLFCPDNKR